MRIIISFLIITVIAAIVYTQQNPELLQGMSGVEAGLAKIKQIGNELTSSDQTKDSQSLTGTKIYKTRDSNGNWQFTNQAPTDSSRTEVQVYQPNANVIPSVSSTEADSATEEKSTQPIKATPFLPFTQPNAVKKLMNDAKSVEKTLQDRHDTMNKQLDNL